MWCPGNAEWLYCKIRVCGVSSVIQDLDQCSQYMDCTESRLIRDTVVLLKPSVDFLDGHMGQFPGTLLSDCLPVAPVQTSARLTLLQTRLSFTRSCWPDSAPWPRLSLL